MLDYTFLDSGDGRKLERFGAYVLDRPEVKAGRWRPKLTAEDWERADACFVESSADQGRWQQNRPLPEEWTILGEGLAFALKLTPFKHVGIFPEQSDQWAWLRETIAAEKRSEPVKILNLFAYTGAATLACAAAGAMVTHVEASRSTLSWARHNAELSALAAAPIRWIPEDAFTFLQRLKKRGEKYDGIILDPPVYGVGPGGQRWQFGKQINETLDLCRDVLSDQPLFVLLNDYAENQPPEIWQTEFERLFSGKTEAGKLKLSAQSGAPDLVTGTWVRWWGGLIDHVQN
jgi:23S rRNA (cytosine1962-C5)-methyltransferase